MFKIAHIGTSLDLLGDFLFFGDKNSNNICLYTFGSEDTPLLFPTSEEADKQLDTIIVRNEIYNDDINKVLTPVCREEFIIIEIK